MAAIGWRLVLFVLMGMAAMPAHAQAPGAGTGAGAAAGAGAASAYLVTYFEAAPAAADAVAGTLKQFAADPARTTAMSGSSRLRETGARQRFAFFEGGATRRRLRRMAGA